METAIDAVEMPIPFRRKVTDAALMLLFFEGSQGMTLFRLPRLIFWPMR